MYYRVVNELYFQQLGFNSNFITSKGDLKKRNIDQEFKQIIDCYEDEFHAVKIPLERLRYNSIYTFGYSLLQMILASGFTPIEVRR